MSLYPTINALVSNLESQSPDYLAEVYIVPSELNDLATRLQTLATDYSNAYTALTAAIASNPYPVSTIVYYPYGYEDPTYIFNILTFRIVTVYNATIVAAERMLTAITPAGEPPIIFDVADLYASPAAATTEMSNRFSASPPP